MSDVLPAEDAALNFTTQPCIPNPVLSSTLGSLPKAYQGITIVEDSMDHPKVQL
jgi:hypothetical protein